MTTWNEALKLAAGNEEFYRYVDVGDGATGVWFRFREYNDWEDQEATRKHFRRLVGAVDTDDGGTVLS